MRVFLLDNHDSFTWNLAQYLECLGAEVVVETNDRITPDEVLAGAFDALVISPGPGRPEDAGITEELVRAARGTVPLLGVCLGHQAVAHVYGGRIVEAPALVHGKTTPIHHDGRTIFHGLPSPFDATRYHSLAVDPESFPADLEVSARAPDGTIMALRLPGLPVEGVQFHPESILTLEGMRVLGNFLDLARRARR